MSLKAYLLFISEVHGEGLDGGLLKNKCCCPRKVYKVLLVLAIFPLRFHRADPARDFIINLLLELERYDRDIFAMSNIYVFFVCVKNFELFYQGLRPSVPTTPTIRMTHGDWLWITLAI